MLKKSLTVVLTAILLFFTQSAILAANEPTFSIPDVESISAQESFTINIKISGSYDICAFNFKLNYDADYIKYEYGSVKSNYFNSITVNDTGNSLRFAWETYGNATVKSGTIISFTFTAKENFTSGSTEVILDCDEIYSMKNNQFQLLKAATINLAKATINSDDNAISVKAQAVIDKINGLGAVQKTEEYKKKLDDALNAYSALSEKDKKNVTNYNELVAKYEEYGRVETETKVEEFKRTHKKTLALRTSTVKLSDKAAVTAALEELSKLSGSEQLKLSTEKLLLKSLKTIIDKLEKENKEQLDKENLKKEATEMVKAFKADNAWIYDLSLDRVYSLHKENLSGVVASLEEIAVLNDLAYQMLNDDGTVKHVNALYKKATDLYAKENPEDKEYIDKADDFRSMFSYVLNLNPSDLQYEDLTDVNLAYTTLKFLDAKTRSYLTKEAKILEELLEKGESLTEEKKDTETESEEEQSSQTQSEVKPEIITKYETVTSYITETVEGEEKVVYKNAADKYKFEYSQRKLGKAVWILIVLCVVALVVLIGVRIMYYYLIKKDRGCGECE